MILSLIIFISIVFLLFILSMFWPPDSPWFPWKWETSRSVAREICKLAKISEKDIIYDLGSGNGTALIVAASEFGAKGIGVEIDPMRYHISRIRVRSKKLNNKIKIYRKNLFNINLSDATVINVYLVPRALRKLKQKLLKELKPGTRVVSYRYEIDLPLVKYDEENEIRLYKIPD